MFRIFKNVLNVFFLAVVVFLVYVVIINNPWRVLANIGVVKDTVNVAGTGSMYPTFPKGSGKNVAELGKQIVASVSMRPYPDGLIVFNKRYFNNKIGRGDIVSFSNEKTKEITAQIYGENNGYIKRAIALSGDTVEIRDGLVYLNGKSLAEPYTAQAHSTFGGGFLGECKALKIPQGKIFVLGDNRKASADSRFDLGLVNSTDIDHFISYKEQIGTLDKNWRNTALDLSNASKIKMDASEFLKLLNEKRNAIGIGALKYVSSLELSAKFRAQVIIKYNDFTSEAVKSGYTVSKSVNDAGYFNIKLGEIPLQGYYTAAELLENIFEFPTSKDFVLNKDFQDFGLTALEGNIAGCPTQVIVLHFGGYIPANYSKEVINSWQKALDNLKEVQLGWQKLKNIRWFYFDHKKDVDRINTILSYRIDMISQLLIKMTASKWLTDEENSYLPEDSKLAAEQQVLSEKLNKEITSSKP